MDQDKLIGKDVKKISKGEIDAWHKGKDDALRNKLLESKLSVNRVSQIIKLFAQWGDVFRISTQVNMNVGNVRSTLAIFNINSIEDARAIMNSGVIAEYDKAMRDQHEKERLQHKVDEKDAAVRFAQDQQSRTPQTKTVEEKDQDLATKRQEAQDKNAADKIRQLIADGVNPKTGQTTGFGIPLSQIKEFKSLIPYGVSQLQRRFGGTTKDIVSEIKRLAPEYEVDTLRP